MLTKFSSISRNLRKFKYVQKFQLRTQSYWKVLRHPVSRLKKFMRFYKITHLIHSSNSRLTGDNTLKTLLQRRILSFTPTNIFGVSFCSRFTTIKQILQSSFWLQVNMTTCRYLLPFKDHLRIINNSILWTLGAKKVMTTKRESPNFINNWPFSLPQKIRMPSFS